MRVSDIVNENIDTLVARLERSGGTAYGRITNGLQDGVLGLNDKGSKPVYFVMYADGKFDRMDHPATQNDLRQGWSSIESMLDPLTQQKADKEKTKAAREAKFTEEIRLSAADVAKLIPEIGSEIADAYPEYLYGNPGTGVERIGGRLVATVEMAVICRNDDYQDGRSEQEFQDTLYYKFWRDSKNPDIIRHEYVM